MRLLIVAALVALVVVFAALRSRDRIPPLTQPLPVVADVPEFAFIDSSGAAVSKSDLLGRPWAANFFFTSCTGPCPVLSLRMRSIQSSVVDEGLDAGLVSFSVDPKYDRPKVLRRYAEKHAARADVWTFLTADDPQAMYDFAQKGMLQPLSPKTSSTPIIHSGKIVIVDSRGRIRSWHEGEDPLSRLLVMRDLRWLANNEGGS